MTVADHKPSTPTPHAPRTPSAAPGSPSSVTPCSANPRTPRSLHRESPPRRRFPNPPQAPSGYGRSAYYEYARSKDAGRSLRQRRSSGHTRPRPSRTHPARPAHPPRNHRLGIPPIAGIRILRPSRRRRPHSFTEHAIAESTKHAPSLSNEERVKLLQREIELLLKDTSAAAPEVPLSSHQ